MKSKCPKVANTRWLSLGNVTQWLLKNRIRLQDYLQQKQPGCMPPKIWWIYLAVAQAASCEINISFVSRQGLVALISQQLSDLDKLQRNLIELVSARHQLVNINVENPSVVAKGGYFVNEIGAVSMIKDCGSFFEQIYNELHDNEKVLVWRDVAQFMVSLINGISTIKCYSDGGNSQYFPAVLPHQLVKMRTHEFNCVLNEQCQRYLSFRTSEDKQQVEEDHRTLLSAYRNEDALREVLNSHTDQISFEHAWNVVSGRFEYLKEFCGGLATIFPGTATVESDFSVANFEKNSSRAQLTDLSLEGIFHCKQFTLINKLNI